MLFVPSGRSLLVYCYSRNLRWGWFQPAEPPSGITLQAVPFSFLVCLICVQLNYLSLSRSSTCHGLGIVYNSLLRSSRSFSACSLARMNYLISELVDCFSILFIAYYVFCYYYYYYCYVPSELTPCCCSAFHPFGTQEEGVFHVVVPPMTMGAGRRVPLPYSTQICLKRPVSA